MMTDKQIIQMIIDDQKETIHRLQDECTEKTNAIIALGEQLARKEQECEELKKYEYHYLDKFLKLKDCLTEIKEMCNSEVCDYIQCSLNYNHSEDFECEKTSCGRAHRRKFILDILQKISECEVEE